MIAYLIGGPQDMIKMFLRGDPSIVSFAYAEPMPVEPPHDQALPQDAYVHVQNIIYRKVYENFGRGGDPYSIYVRTPT